MLVDRVVEQEVDIKAVFRSLHSEGIDSPKLTLSVNIKFSASNAGAIR